VLKIEHYYLHECTYVHIKKYQKLGVYLDMFFFKWQNFALFVHTVCILSTKRASICLVTEHRLKTDAINLTFDEMSNLFLIYVN
jgi:hypothetical protein